MTKFDRAAIAMSSRDVDDLLATVRTMSVATVGPDGWPHVVAMWFAVHEGLITFMAYRRSQKCRNLLHNDRVTCLVEAGEQYEELRGVQIRGRAMEVGSEARLAAACAVAARYSKMPVDPGAVVLVPDVVDVAGGVPVLAAGGVGSGRQVAAALALGPSGVWTGSIWLTTAESDEPPIVKDNLLAADAKDAVRSRAITGKPCRQLRTEWTDAFDAAGSPGALPMPLQSLLFAPANDHIKAAGARALAGQAVGQIVGRMHVERRAADVYLEMVRESLDVVERLHDIFVRPS